MTYDVALVFHAADEYLAAVLQVEKVQYHLILHQDRIKQVRQIRRADEQQRQLFDSKGVPHRCMQSVDDRFQFGIDAVEVNRRRNDKHFCKRRSIIMKEAAKVFIAFGVVGSILFFFVGADGGPFWSWILFFVFAVMLLVGICLNSAARKKEQKK